MMLATAALGIDAAVIVRASKIGPGIEFTLFIAAVMGTLNFLLGTYFRSAERINAAPPEKQTEMLLSLGCLVVVLMALLVPVTLVLLWKT